jgi:hypothetical protein
MLHLTGAPYGIDPHFPLMSFDSAEAPQSIVQAIAIEDGEEGQRFVIGLGLAQVLEQLFPALLAGGMVADLV